LQFVTASAVFAT